MKSAVFIFACFYFVIISRTYSQNLILNPDFELEDSLSQKEIIKRSYFTATGWMPVGNGDTPDYYTLKHPPLVSCPPYTPAPFSGKAYAGLVLFPDPDPRWGFCEHLQSKLKQKLQKDRYYCFTAYVTPDHTRSYTTNEIDFLFSAEKLYSPEGKMIDPPQFEKFVAAKRAFEPNAWNKISACYLANGDEQFITISIFNRRCKRLSLITGPAEFHGFYLFFDNLSLVPVKDTSECHCNKLEVIRNKKNKFDRAIDKHITLENINFESGKARLLPGSEKELNELAAYLTKSPELKIEIAGHTDNVGNENENLNLSKARAEAVAAWLIKAGIDPKRINTSGHGSAFPLKPNNNDENRRQNRRVELSLLR